MWDRGVCDLMTGAANLDLRPDPALSIDNVHSVKAPFPFGEAIAWPRPAGAVVVANMAVRASRMRKHFLDHVPRFERVSL